MGFETKYGYDDLGNLKTITDPLNKTTTLKYDAGNNLESVIDPSNAVTLLSHDGMGNLLSLTDATERVTTFSYDFRNQVTSVTDPLNNVTTYSYDKSGNSAGKTDANGNVTTYSHDFLGQLTGIKNALNHVTSLTYGAPGCSSCSSVDKLTALLDAKNQKTSWSYDKVSRLESETDPLAKVTTYGYGPGKNPTSRKDANGATVEYGYDALQRLKQKTYPDGAIESYTYDARDNVLTAANKDVSYVFTYDAANRVKTVSDSRGYAISYDYDAAGNRIKMVLQPGTANERVTEYSYDDVGRLASMLTTAGTFAFGYDSANRRTSLAYPNQVTTAYGYDGAGRLDGVTYKTQGGEVVSAVTYTHDAVGNRLSKGGVCTETYAYDSIDQLLSSFSTAGAEQFSYDEVGNRLWGPGRKDTGYEHDAANRMAKGRQFVYSYDENGNQIIKAIPGNPNKGWTYNWDYEDRLVKAERIAGGDGRTVAFKYDPFGRRIEKSFVVTVDGTTKTTTWRYFYDNADIVIETVDDGGSTTAMRYDHGPGIDEHLAMEKESHSYFYHADGLGSVVSITDASGSVVQSYSYDSFGMLKPSTGFQNSYTYTGREWDKEAGLYYYRARYYDPMEGRFISKDPISFSGGDVNLYGYTGNSPIIFVDPSGLDAIIAWGWWWSAAGEAATAGSAATAGAVAGMAAGIVLGFPSSIAEEPDVNAPTSNICYKQHTKNARPSTKPKHEAGQARKKQDKGGEKADKNRTPPRVRPPNWKGPWPPPE